MSDIMTLVNGLRRFLLWYCWILIFSLLPTNLHADSLLNLETIKLNRGQRGTLTLQGTTDFAYQAFSASIGFDPNTIHVSGVSFAETIVEGLNGDFVQANVNNDRGSVVIGVQMELLPPFEDIRIPGISQPLDLAHIEVVVPWDVEPPTDSRARLKFIDNFGRPPIKNVLVVDNLSQPWDRMIEGVVILNLPDPFRRGDVNQDSSVDLTDSLMVMGYLFLGTERILCMDSADVNDNERIELGDAIYLLEYYFLGYDPPNDPFQYVGMDPTPGRLDCQSYQ